MRLLFLFSDLFRRPCSALAMWPLCFDSSTASRWAIFSSCFSSRAACRPFSEKHDQEYFSDGLSEELIDLLTKVPELRVPARTSAFYFKGRQATIALSASAARTLPPTPNLDAYSLYLEGRYSYSRTDKRAAEAAVIAFSQAVALDPGFAAAWAYLGKAHVALYLHGWTPRVNACPAARRLRTRRCGESRN